MSHPFDDMTESDLHNLINSVCTVVNDMLPPDTGFCILMFPFGKAGNSQYGSNCNREDMVRALREAANRLDNREDKPR